MKIKLFIVLLIANFFMVSTFVLPANSTEPDSSVDCKKIAIYDFIGHEDNPEIGKIVSDELSAHLKKESTKNLSIINPKKDNDTISKMLLDDNIDKFVMKQLRNTVNAEILIIGEVSRYFVVSTDNPVMERASTIVYEKADNLEYSDWVIKHPKLKMEDLLNAPPREIKKKKVVLVSYRKGSVKINAYIDISYKIINILAEKLIIKDLISGKSMKIDEYQEGVPSANIPTITRNITEAQVIDQLRKDKVIELSKIIDGVISSNNIQR